MRVAQIYSIRGTPKSSEHFASQAIELAQDLGSSRLVARATIARAQVRLSAANLIGCSEDLDATSALLNSVCLITYFAVIGKVTDSKHPQSTCPEAIDVRRVQADLHARLDSTEEAHSSYLEAQQFLDRFTEAANEDDALAEK